MINIQACAYKSIKDFLRKSRAEQERIISDIETNIKTKCFDFGKIEYRKVKGRRVVGTYSNNYTEIVLLNHIFMVLTKLFHIKFANRDTIMTKVFDIIDILPKRGSSSALNDFTLVRFDFKEFFYSISTEYVFEKYIKYSYLNRDNSDIIKSFVHSVKYCVAGISLSNIFAEIIASDFDSVLKQKLHSCGLVLYERYIDDGMIIVGKYIEESSFKKILDETIEQVFYDPAFADITSMNKVKLSVEKFYYLSSRDVVRCGHNFNFLGYDFSFDNYLNFKFGITNEKITKYEQKIDKIFSKYYVSNPILVKYFVKCFSSRVVYKDPFGNSWVNKGVIATYKELGRHLDLLDKKTSIFLRDVFKYTGIKYGSLPKYIKIGKTYNMFSNLESNRAMVFNEIIGYSSNDLINMILHLGKMPISTSNYDSLVSQFLSEIKIGKIK